MNQMNQVNQVRNILAFFGGIIAAFFVMIVWQWYHLPMGNMPDLHQTQPLPRPLQHVGIIMDGNRRWARSQGLPVWDGHKKGGDPLKMTLEFCLEHKIPHLTVYAFSLENFNRSQQELDYLFNAIEQGISDPQFQALVEQGINVHVLGDRSKFPAHLTPLIDDLEQKTKNHTRLTFNILFCYGGKQELTATIKNIAKQVQDGALVPEDINPEIIQKNLLTAHSPNPDLIIRTGKEKRLSNFLPWQSVYSELIFLDKYWPEITQDDLYQALQEYAARERKFGQ